jgi:hypothetical protein
MSLTFTSFFENYTSYHSFIDLLNLCKEVSDYVYNNDITNSQFFDGFKETSDGYAIIFNKSDKKNYFVNANKKKVTDDNGDEQVIDKVYEDIETLFSILQNDEMLINIKQMDEKMKTFDDVINEDNGIKTFGDLFPINETFEEELKPKLSEKYISLKRGIMELLDTHLKGDVTKLQDFITTFVQPDSEEIIEGFVEDADILDNYFKFQSDIDQILLDHDYYDDAPEVESLYDYVIDGTYDAFVYCMEEIKKDLYE